MPVVNPASDLLSPPSNAWGLVQYLAGRVPGYDSSEYLREINSAYIHVWEEITKLRNNYFVNFKQVAVVNAQQNYDLLFNTDGGLSSAISPRIYQIVRVRCLSPNGGIWQVAAPYSLNHPDYTGMASLPLPTPTATSPYPYTLFGRGNIQFALPLAIGTQIEVAFSFWPLAMTYQSVGSVSSSGTTVTGVETAFTQMVQPDFAGNLPTVQGQEEIQAEFVCNGTVPAGGQVYRVTTIANDTSLTTATAINPALVQGSPYVLATLPEIPREHIRVIAAIALPKVYGWTGDDARITEATAIAEKNIQMMKDALIERQAQAPPRKIRFPGSLSMRNRAFSR